MSKKIRVDIVGDNKKLKSSVKDSQKSINGLGDTIKKVGGLIAGAFAVDKLKQFAKSSLDAYNVQAQAENTLLIALKGRRDIQQKLIAQAQELQRTTLFGDEETIRAQSLAASMGLTFDQITELIPAAQNLAAAMGQTLDFGVKNLARTYGGLSGELGELIPQLRTLTKEEMMAGDAIKLVGDMMGGQAEAAAAVGTGGLTQFKNIVGDITEEVGYAIVELTGMNEKLKNFGDTVAGIDIKSTVDEYTAWRKENENTNKVLLSLLSPLKAVNEYNKAAIGFIRDRVGGEKDLEEQYEHTGAGARLLAQAAADVAAEDAKAKKAAEELKKQLEKEREEYDKLNETLVAAREAKEALNDIDIQLRNSNESFLKSFQNTDEEFRKTQPNVSKLNDELYALGMSFDDVEELMPEPELDALIDKFWEGQDAAAAFEQQMESLAGNVLANLGEDFGNAAAGVESLADVIQDITRMIWSELGNIMIAAGLQAGIATPQGLGLILAGIAMRGVGAYINATADNDMEMARDVGYSQQGSNEFVIRGDNLVSAYDNNKSMNQRLY